MKRDVAVLLLILSTALLSNCAVGPDYCPPESPETDRYTESKLPAKTVASKGRGGKSQRFINGRDIPAEWWRIFRSPELNCLIERGLAHSPNLAAAKAVLCQTKENMHAYVGATFLPAVNGVFAAQRLRFSNATLGGDPSVPSTVFSLYNAGVNVSYTLDVFGGARRQLEALYAQIDYEVFQWEAAYLTLTSNIVTTAITEASLRAQIQATHELIRLNTNQLEIIKKQFKLGGVSKTNVLAQENQLAAIKATLPALQKQLEFTRHSLAVLVGSLPSESELPNFYLNNLYLPKDIPVSIPSSLVCQRPDIRASEALLHQACATVGVATANLYPQIALTANYGNQSNQFSKLFTGSNLVWDYMAQLTQPIFAGGSLRAKRRAAIEGFHQAAAQYQQTILTAFQNVADSLQAIEEDARTLQAQTEAERTAKATLDLVQKQYKLGAVNYLNLLDANRQYQLAIINRIQAEAARYTDTAALFQALGGGWWNRVCEM